MEWISIENRLPEHNQFVLATGKTQNMVVLRCDISLGNYVFMSPDLTHQVTGVTHWMPLPPPPESAE